MVLRIESLGEGGGCRTGPDTPPPPGSSEPAAVGRHPQGEVGDKGRLGQLHVKGNLFGLVCTVDGPRGDNVVRKAGGHLAADLGAVDLDAIDHLRERWARIRWAAISPTAPWETRSSAWLLPSQMLLCGAPKSWAPQSSQSPTLEVWAVPSVPRSVGYHGACAMPPAAAASEVV